MGEAESFASIITRALIIFFASVFFGSLIVLFLFTPKDANSEERPIQPTILFSFDGDPAEVDHFELHWIPVPGSGIVEFLFNLDDTTTREWKTPEFGMEPGDVRPFYLVVVMSDGRKGWSMYYDFMFTGKPFIFKVEQGEVL